VFYTTIPNLKITIPDNPSRLKSVPTFDRENNCYVLCVQPTDKTVGGIAKYNISISGDQFKPMPAFPISNINAGVTQYFKINPKESEQARLERLKREEAERKAEAAEREAEEAKRNSGRYNDDNKKFHLGIVAGLALANQNSDSWIYEDAKNAKAGFAAGLLFEYKFSSNFSFQPELLFVQKGAKGKSYTSDTYIYTNTGEYISDVLIDATVQVNYLELPLNYIINIPTSDNSAFFFGYGYTLAYGLSGKITKEPSKDDISFYLSKEEKEEDVFDGEEPIFNRFDGSVNLLAGFRINRFFVRASYEWGDNIAANTDEGYYYFKNTCFNFSVGVKF